MSIKRVSILAAAAVIPLAAVGAVWASPATATVPACGNPSLVVKHTATQGATGHGSFVLRFLNVSAAACSLFGYPGLDALGPGGVVLAHAQRTMLGFAGGAHTETTVTLNPGGVASATAEWLNFDPTNGGDCTFSTSVATTPPNTSDTVHFRLAVSVCQLQIHPTVAGGTGSN